MKDPYPYRQMLFRAIARVGPSARVPRVFLRVSCSGTCAKKCAELLSCTGGHITKDRIVLADEFPPKLSPERVKQINPAAWAASGRDTG